MYTVNLTYFKKSGKYYSGGRYKTGLDELHLIFQEVRNFQELGLLPDLVTGATEFHVLVDVPLHPHNHPYLCIL